MNKITNINPEATEKAWGRLLSVADLMQYTGLGRNNAIAFGERCGAKRKIGKRSLYDRKVIDKYINDLPPVGQEEALRESEKMRTVSFKKGSRGEEE